MQIGVVDYGASNIFSVLRALTFLGADAKIISKREDFNSVDKIILPGQGSMGACIENLKKNELLESLKNKISEKPYLGICLGLQVLFSVSEESLGDQGLNIFPEKIERFIDSKNLKIPHMGWNELTIKVPNHPVLKNVRQGAFFYFVHSFQMTLKEEKFVIATTEYGGPITAVVGINNIIGTQFHPEKSQKMGLAMLENFLNWRP